MDNIKNFGPNLRTEIKNKGYKTYKKAADAFGISLSYLNQLMRNEREPSFELLKVISDELGIPASKLIDDDEQSPHNTHTSNPTAPPKESHDRAQSILNIQSDLNILTDRELKNVAKFISDLKMRRTMSSGSGSAGAV